MIFIASAVHGMYDPSDTSSGAAVWDDLNWEFDQYLDIVDAGWHSRLLADCC